MPWAPKKRARAWNVVDQRRESAAARGYDHRWEEASKRYRDEHPLCVQCLLHGRTTPCQAVDHIVPIACCPELLWEDLNWAALCKSCHSYKTCKEPRTPWGPDHERIVICGLPGTGKSTWAKERGVPYFDADERGLVDRVAIIAARNAWIKKHGGPVSVIVASTLSASNVAAQLGGVVRHMTTQYVERVVRFAHKDAPRPAARRARRGGVSV